ncbi:MAG: pirin family protein [Rhodobiaceae bacterium]|nr:pirin family protein [Rhodobiaceae bacterium]MCC0054776.1 pirin family protein [Rhodobiaceae bacterium]
MSWQSAPDPRPGDAHGCDAVETVILGRSRDVGGFDVRRVLPSARRRMVGPFIFLDQMGPAEFLVGNGIDVQPHPHIGLATVTYLLDGEITHRDSLGTEMKILPGEVNWMTAGRGIVHSERTAPEVKARGSRILGLQSWVALPKDQEETAPAFVHVGRGELPVIEGEGNSVRLVAGTFAGASAPVHTASAMVYADATMRAGARLPIDADHEERAVYVLSGRIEIAGETFESGGLLILKPGERVALTALADSRLMIIGGETMDGPRHIWWNFVSSRKERIDQAKADWKAGRFDTVPGDEKEFVPLPE